MANTLKNLFRGTIDNTAGARVTAGAAEIITIKRWRALNNSGAATNVSIWAGSAADDAHAIVKVVTLNAGESLEADPTMLVLNPGENLYAQSSVAGAITLGVDGLSQT